MSPLIYVLLHVCIKAGNKSDTIGYVLKSQSTMNPFELILVRVTSASLTRCIHSATVILDSDNSRVFNESFQTNFWILISLTKSRLYPVKLPCKALIPFVVFVVFVVFAIVKLFNCLIG